MPHLIIEYSEEIFSASTISDLMTVVHISALNSGQFGELDIKVRAMPYGQSLVAGKSGSFMHVVIKLLSGREQEIKKQLTQSVHDALLEAGVRVNSLSVEAVDIERESYTKTLS